MVQVQEQQRAELLVALDRAIRTRTRTSRAEALVRRTGCLYVYSSRETAGQWAWGMALRRSLGVQLRDIEREELEHLEPDLRGRLRFGILAPENGSTPDPSALVKALHAQAVADGARFVATAIDVTTYAAAIRDAAARGLALKP